VRHPIRIERVFIRHKIDEQPDLTNLGNYSNTNQPGAIFRANAGTREFRYFIPAMTGEQTGNPDSPRQDFERMEAYNRGDWQSLGVFAEAIVSYPDSPNCRRTERFTSSGLWGVESDSGDYIAEVEKEQLAELKDHLAVFCVDTSNFEELANARGASLFAT
jgi:hypothetical protein